MSDFTTRQHTAKSYVLPLDDVNITPPPPPIVEVQHGPTVETNLGLVLTIANLMITAIIITAMILDGSQTKNAIIAGSCYFAITMTSFALVTTGTLSTIVNGWQRERTERQRVAAYRHLGEMAIEWRLAVEQNRALELQAEATPTTLARRLAQLEQDLLDQRLSADPPRRASTFVAPYSNQSKTAFAESAIPDTTAQEALQWASALYMDNGVPDPAQVQTSGEKAGWLKVRMLGSKRGIGSKEAGLWLLHHRVILRAAGGYKLNLKRFPPPRDFALPIIVPTPRGEWWGG